MTLAEFMGCFVYVLQSDPLQRGKSQLNLQLLCNVKSDPECGLQDELIDTTFSFSSQVFLFASYRNSAYAADLPRAVPRYAQNLPRHITASGIAVRLLFDLTCTRCLINCF